MKQNSKKLLYSLYAAGAVLGASLVSGCQQTRYVYLNADGSSYTPTTTYTPTSYRSSGSCWSNLGRAFSGMCAGMHF